MSLFTWPLEETVQCGYCRHVGNVCDFLIGTGDESECPNCGFPEETPPHWDEEDIANAEKTKHEP